MMHTKRLLFVVFLVGLLFSTTDAGWTSGKKKKMPCAANIEACSDQGCGTDFDPNLNKLKNIRSDDPRAAGPATPKTLTSIKKLDDPENFEKGASREELTTLGEGRKVSVVAYLLVAKPELSGESCNCGLHTKEATDNHLVLVTKTTVDKFPRDENSDEQEAQKIFHSREEESITAEFTPRVRKTHPNFTREKVQPLIDAADEDALLVRVTGLLLFDSEHFLANHLNRVNNWEIHPVLKFEVCSTGNCKAGSDVDWKSVDDM